MSVLFTDGFEWAGDNLLDVSVKWDSYYSYLSGSKTKDDQARTGTYSWYMERASSFLKKNLAGSPDTLIMGAGFYISNPGYDCYLFTLEESGTDQVVVKYDNTDGSIKVYRNTTQIAASAASVMSINNWHYVEAKITIHQSAGIVEVYVDGDEVINDTGLDTCATSNEYADSFLIGNTGSNLTYPYCYVDDVYLLDDNGTANNDILGPIKIYTKFPDADGNYGAWTPQGAGDSYVEIDEVPPDDDTTYIYSTSPGNRDTHSFETLSASGTIAAAVLNMNARKEGAGTRTIKGMCRSNGTDEEGTEQTISDTYHIYQEAFEEDPDTSAAWANAAAINAAEFGIRDQA